jgi:hypothetical protein
VCVCVCIFLSVKEGKLKFFLQMYVFIKFRMKIMCLNLPYNKVIFKIYILTFKN